MMRKLTVIACCFLAGACSLMVDRNTHDYPQGSKDAFMNSCMKNSGDKKEACACMLAKVQEKYTYGEMDDLEQKIKAGETPPEFTEFMTKVGESCLQAASANSK